jgi:hypothetical protein
MSKTKVIFEFDGEVKTVEVDQFVMVSMNGGTVTTTRHRAADPEALGLLEMGKWHVAEEWRIENTKKS